MRITIDVDARTGSVVFDTPATQPATPWQDGIGIEDWMPYERITRDTQRALFAAFSNVFGDTRQARRHLFTRMLLGRRAGGSGVSWATLSEVDALKVLDVLDAIERTDAMACRLTA